MSPSSLPPEALARLWDVPVYLPVLQPALTDDMVAVAEQALGVKLPRAYLDLLRIQNGGYLRAMGGPSGCELVDFIPGVGPRHPSIVTYHQPLRVAPAAPADLLTPPLHNGLVPFCGDGHYLYCLDYRASGPAAEPRVVFLDVGDGGTDVVADDFAFFLGALELARSSAIGLMTEQPYDMVLRYLEDLSGRTFDLGDRNDPYAESVGARLDPGGGNVFLLRNYVRRGMVRRDDREYETLLSLLPEIVARYPDHGDCAYFVMCDSPESVAATSLSSAVLRGPIAARSLVLLG